MSKSDKMISRFYAERVNYVSHGIPLFLSIYAESLISDAVTIYCQVFDDLRLKFDDLRLRLILIPESRLQTW